MNMKWSRLFLVSAVAVGIMFTVGCKKKFTGTSDTRNVLGTTVTITIYDREQTPESRQAAFDAAFSLMSDWEKRALKSGPDNQVYHISEGAGEQSVSSDPDVFQMLMKAIRLYDNSGGAFDIRYGPMIDAWGFGDGAHVPAPEQLDTLRSYVTEGGMFVAGNGILLAKPGMKFDAREIVVGYVFDLVAAQLAERGVRTATINSPYVWRIIGETPDRRGFKVTFAHPATGDSDWVSIWSPAGGVAYSAATKDRFESGGKYYHSLLDPRTGMPADRLLGAIVHSADAATAQALSYAVFVHGSVDSLDAGGKKALSGTAIISGTTDSPNVNADGIFSGQVHTR